MSKRTSAGSIGRRLAGAFAGVLVLGLAGSGIGYWSLNEVAQETRAIVAGSLVKERLVADWFHQTSSNVRRVTAVSVTTDAAVADYFAREIAGTAKVIAELQKRLEPLLVEPAEQAAYARIGEARTVYLKARDQLNADKQSGDTTLARRTLDTQFVPGADKYMAELEALSHLQRRRIDESAAYVDSVNERARWALAGFAVCALLLGAGLAAWLVRGITGPIRRAVAVADRIAGFDLTERIESHDRDETGQLLRSLHAMQESLRGLVAQVRSSSESMSTASSEIADGNLDLSARTEQAASSLQQTAASIEQMTGAVNQSAASAQTARTLAGGAAEVAQQGGQVVDQVVTTMAAINESSKKISEIIGVIDGIAFQTNILALNAAVEAARAGEQGRGFAVVASEVRSLAQRSADAAKEIKALIGSSVDKVESGTSLVSEAGAKMAEIVGSVQRVSKIIHEISAAATEQSAGIGQVNDAVLQLDKATQQNAALVEQSAAAAESLKSQAQQLAEKVSVFRIG